MKTPKNIIQRVKNTLNEFPILRFYEVGEFDYNCENLRNREETVLIRFDAHETTIMLYNLNAVEYVEPMYTIFKLPHENFKSFTGYMCVLFATVKEYYERTDVRNYHNFWK